MTSTTTTISPMYGHFETLVDQLSKVNPFCKEQLKTLFINTEKKSTLLKEQRDRMLKYNDELLDCNKKTSQQLKEERQKSRQFEKKTLQLEIQLHKQTKDLRWQLTKKEKQWIQQLAKQKRQFTKELNILRATMANPNKYKIKNNGKMINSIAFSNNNSNNNNTKVSQGTQTITYSGMMSDWQARQLCRSVTPKSISPTTPELMQMFAELNLVNNNSNNSTNGSGVDGHGLSGINSFGNFMMHDIDDISVHVNGNGSGIAHASCDYNGPNKFDFGVNMNDIKYNGDIGGDDDISNVYCVNANYKYDRDCAARESTDGSIGSNYGTLDVDGRDNVSEQSECDCPECIRKGNAIVDINGNENSNGNTNDGDGNCYNYQLQGSSNFSDERSVVTGNKYQDAYEEDEEDDEDDGEKYYSEAIVPRENYYQYLDEYDILRCERDNLSPIAASILSWVNTVTSALTDKYHELLKQKKKEVKKLKKEIEILKQSLQDEKQQNKQLEVVEEHEKANNEMLTTQNKRPKNGNRYLPKLSLCEKSTFINIDCDSTFLTSFKESYKSQIKVLKAQLEKAKAENMLLKRDRGWFDGKLSDTNKSLSINQGLKSPIKFQTKILAPGSSPYPKNFSNFDSTIDMPLVAASAAEIAVIKAKDGDGNGDGNGDGDNVEAVSFIRAISDESAADLAVALSPDNSERSRGSTPQSNRSLGDDDDLKTVIIKDDRNEEEEAEEVGLDLELNEDAHERTRTMSGELTTEFIRMTSTRSDHDDKDSPNSDTTDELSLKSARSNTSTKSNVSLKNNTGNVGNIGKVDTVGTGSNISSVSTSGACSSTPDLNVTTPRNLESLHIPNKFQHDGLEENSENVNKTNEIISKNRKNNDDTSSAKNGNYSPATSVINVSNGKRDTRSKRRKSVNLDNEQKDGLLQIIDECEITPIDDADHNDAADEDEKQDLPKTPRKRLFQEPLSVSIDKLRVDTKQGNYLNISKERRLTVSPSFRRDIDSQCHNSNIKLGKKRQKRSTTPRAHGSGRRPSVSSGSFSFGHGGGSHENVGPIKHFNPNNTGGVHEIPTIVDHDIDGDYGDDEFEDDKVQTGIFSPPLEDENENANVSLNDENRNNNRSNHSNNNDNWRNKNLNSRLHNSSFLFCDSTDSDTNSSHDSQKSLNSISSCSPANDQIKKNRRSDHDHNGDNNNNNNNNGDGHMRRESINMDDHDVGYDDIEDGDDSDDGLRKLKAHNWDVKSDSDGSCVSTTSTDAVLHNSEDDDDDDDGDVPDEF